MISDLMFSALKNLRRKKLRTFLTMLGIIIGVSSVATVLLIGSSGKKAISDEFNRFGLNGLVVRGAENGTGKKGILRDSELNKIKSKIKEATSIMPVMYYFGSVLDREARKDCLIWGIGDNAKETISLTALYGNNLNFSDIKNCSYNCVTDTVMAKQVFKRENAVGKELSVLINGRLINFKIKGIINANDSMLTNLAGDYIPAFLYIPYTTMQKIYGNKNFDQIVVNVRENSDLDAVGRKIVTLLSREYNAENIYYADNMVKQKKKLENIIAIITAIISAVAAISLVVGGLGIMTIMLAAVSERTREIGIKKAVGATKGMILGEFVAESIAITLTGGVIGILLTFLMSMAADYFVGFKTEFNAGIILISLIFSVIIGIIFSVYPAKKAADLNPISALRYE